MNNEPNLPEEIVFEKNLRPLNFDDYVGQEKVKANLRIIIEAAKKRGAPIEHILLYGPSGLGKTTLANIISREMGANLRVTAGPTIEKVGDLASLLTNLKEGDVLFIDEVHRLNRAVEEVLYPAMEDYKLDIIIGKGPSAKTIELDLPKFTLVSATTRIGLLSSPFRNRFGATYRLDFYSETEMEDIVKRSAQILNLEAEESAIKLLSTASRFTPRVANRVLKRVRDFAEVRGEGRITGPLTKEALTLLEIDELGLGPDDRRLLGAVAEQFQGGPVGLQSLAASTNEEKDTITEVYEPYLMRIGFLARTAQGRILTPRAYQHLGLPKYRNTETLE